MAAVRSAKPPAGDEPKTPDRHATAAARRKLLAWFDGNQRKLPWRETRDPYRIWVSEVMLQQTRVQVVVPYYEKFLRRFPSVEALAAANERSLLACWSGLGYYSRARNLREAARQIVHEHGGVFPRDVAAAMELPGVGQYTAHAVLSIAYGIPLAVLDGNVARVLSRLHALAADPRSTAGKKLLQERAQLTLSRKRPGDLNQALMELGATVCLPRQPRCPACPLRGICAARRQGLVEQFPPTRGKEDAAVRRFVTVLVSDEKGRVLLVQRPKGAGWMQGFWELPMWEQNAGVRRKSSSHSALSKSFRLGRKLGLVRHSITSNRLEVEVFSARLRFPAAAPQGRWIVPDRADSLPVTTITRKAMKLPRRL